MRVSSQHLKGKRWLMEEKKTRKNGNLAESAGRRLINRPRPLQPPRIEHLSFDRSEPGTKSPVVIITCSITSHYRSTNSVFMNAQLIISLIPITQQTSDSYKCSLGTLILARPPLRRPRLIKVCLKD